MASVSARFSKSLATRPGAGACLKSPSGQSSSIKDRERPFGRTAKGYCPEAGPHRGIRDRQGWVESCPSPSLSEVALLSHSPCERQT